MRLSLADIMELLESLLCDKCLALQRREPDTVTGDFCARCRAKLLRDFSAMVEARFGDDPGEEEDA